MKLMEALYDVQAPKKATNLSVNSDLLNRARSLNINLSSTFEAALKQVLAEHKTDLISLNANGKTTDIDTQSDYDGLVNLKK